MYFVRKCRCAAGWFKRHQLTKNGRENACNILSKHATGEFLVKLFNFLQCCILLGLIMVVNTRTILWTGDNNALLNYNEKINE